MCFVSKLDKYLIEKAIYFNPKPILNATIYFTSYMFLRFITKITFIFIIFIQKSIIQEPTKKTRLNRSRS